MCCLSCPKALNELALEMTLKGGGSLVDHYENSFMKRSWKAMIFCSTTFSFSVGGKMVILDRGRCNSKMMKVGIICNKTTIFFFFKCINKCHLTSKIQVLMRCTSWHTNLKWKVPSFCPKPLPGTRQIPSSSSNLIQ